MESCSLQPSSVTTTVTSLTKAKAGFIEKSSLHGQLLRFPNFLRHPNARKLKLFALKAQTSGATKFSSQMVEAIPGDVGLKDEKLAFVSGATGRVGSRTVRELLKLGFRVKAAVRSAQRAETLVQSVKNLKVDHEGAQPIERLEIVECDLEKQDQIVPSLGNASIVVCCIGASEKEVFDITGPYRIDYQATKNLIDAATAANVNHFIMVSSLGTNKFGFPAAILNLFWGVLIWKRKAEEALIASGLPYTIVRPGGMERPTDAYKETHNITLSEEDTLFGGQVSNLQVAELIAFMAKNSDLSYCKVVEVIAETTAPLTPLDKLLAKIPSQRTRPKGSDSADMPMVERAKDIVTEASSTISKEPSVKVKVSSPLSPYTAYEDLKPPTSPTPSAPTGQQIISSAIDAVSSDGQTSSSETAPEITETKPAKIGRPLSPYVVYDDLKPPTSPSPTAPVGSFLSANDEGPKIGNTAPSPASVNELHQIEPQPEPTPKQKPLSPYTMYEDLKPPTSPRPPWRN